MPPASPLSDALALVDRARYTCALSHTSPAPFTQLLVTRNQLSEKQIQLIEFKRQCDHAITAAQHQQHALQRNASMGSLQERQQLITDIARLRQQVLEIERVDAAIMTQLLQVDMCLRDTAQQPAPSSLTFTSKGQSVPSPQSMQTQAVSGPPAPSTSSTHPILGDLLGRGLMQVNTPDPWSPTTRQTSHQRPQARSPLRTTSPSTPAPEVSRHDHLTTVFRKQVQSKPFTTFEEFRQILSPYRIAAGFGVSESHVVRFP